MTAETDHAIALGFAPVKVRGAFTNLLQLDTRLGQIVMQAREATLARIKLQWWHDQLLAARGLDLAADRLLGDVVANIGHHDVTFESLAGLTRGWDLLLDPLPFDAAHLINYARERGERLFELAAQIVGQPLSDALRAAGAGWALGDFAFRCSDRGTAEIAQSLASAHFALHPQRQIGRELRTFALLAQFAAIDAQSEFGKLRFYSARRRAFEALRFSVLR